MTAFVRSLNDPFPPAKNAGLLALGATLEFYDATEIAQRIIPACSHILIDAEKNVRDQAFKTVDAFIKKLEKHSVAMVNILV